MSIDISIEKIGAPDEKVDEVKIGAPDEKVADEDEEYHKLFAEFVKANNEEDLVKRVIIFNELYGHYEDDNDVPYLMYFTYYSTTRFYNIHHEYIRDQFKTAIQELERIYFVDKEYDVTNFVLCAIYDCNYMLYGNKVYEKHDALSYIDEAFELDDSNMLANYFKICYSNKKDEQTIYIEYLIEYCDNMDLLHIMIAYIYDHLYYNNVDVIRIYRRLLIRFKDNYKVLSQITCFVDKHMHHECDMTLRDILKINEDKEIVKCMDAEYTSLYVQIRFTKDFNIKNIIKAIKETKDGSLLNFITYNTSNDMISDKKKLELYEKALEFGYKPALNNIGNCYLSKHKYDDAYDYYIQGLEIEERYSILNLLNIYYYYHDRLSDDRQIDDKMLLNLLNKMKGHGDPHDLKAHALLIMKSKKNVNYAKMYWEKAYDLDDIYGKISLATCFYTGNLVKTYNFPEAYRLLNELRELNESNKHYDENGDYDKNRDIINIAFDDVREFEKKIKYREIA